MAFATVNSYESKRAAEVISHDNVTFAAYKILSIIIINHHVSISGKKQTKILAQIFPGSRRNNAAKL
jgi:hypothetical protein